MSQATQILSHLRTGRALTPLDALQRFGCFRLAARIRDLKAKGHRIKTQLVRRGHAKRVAEYRLG